MNLLEGLNERQKEAVVCTEGALLLFAGAGSGKTRVVTHRIAYLIQNGISPSNILAITFTNKAAREMRERVNALIEEGENVWISTFHSLCVRILRRHIEKASFKINRNFTICDAEEAERLIHKQMKKLNIDEKNVPLNMVMSSISSFKDKLISPEYAFSMSNSTRTKLVANVYALYQKGLESSNCLDFDDIIFLTVELFKKKPEVLSYYQEYFKYIHVDEYQDTSISQYELIRLLSSKYKNICVVGDDDQSIYGWRGANIQNILSFEYNFKDATVIKLEQNYRSTQNILDASNNVVKNNVNRKSKKMWTENDTGGKIEVFEGSNSEEEAKFIVSEILNSVNNNDKKYSDFAVLYRNNFISRAIEEQLVHKNVPYRIFGGVGFYNRKEIKDVLAYLKFIYNPLDAISLLRIINVPKRGIGEISIEKVSAYADSEGISFFEALKLASDITAYGLRKKSIKDFITLFEKLIERSKYSAISEIINKVISETGYLEELERDDEQNDDGRVQNVNELILKAKEFEQRAESTALGEFLEEISLVSQTDGFTEEDDAVRLMTIHSSKGLEFNSVFIAAFEDGILPSRRTKTKEHLEEERRLCYVGMTRAKEKLYLTMSTSRGNRWWDFEESEPSRFLQEIPIEYLKNASVKVAKKPELKPDFKVAKTNSPFKSFSFSTNSYNSEKKQSFALPKEPLKFNVGDFVQHLKYGTGIVKEIKLINGDFEISVEFEQSIAKKFMASICKLTKI